MSPKPNLDDAKRRHAQEEQLTTYTPLFSPPTPRGSPVPPDSGNAAVVALGALRAKALRRSHGATGWEAGFVVVPEMQDPLSLLGQADESEDLLAVDDDDDDGGGGGTHCQDQSSSSSSLLFSPPSPPGPRQDNHAHSPGTATSNTTTTQARHAATVHMAANSTLAFFDKFVSEARAASESKRRSVLDEILLHQDDPLFHWSTGADDGADGASDGAGGESAADIDGDGNKPEAGGDEDNNSNDQDKQADIRQLQDALNSPIPTVRKRRKRRPSGLSTTSTSTPNSPRHSPRHSPTLPTLPTLAPPLQSTHTVSISIPAPSPTAPTPYMPLISGSPHLQHHSYLHNTRPSSSPASSTIAHSPKATLSGLPTRWMSSLLSSSSPPSPTCSSSLPASTRPHIPPHLAAASAAESSVATTATATASDTHDGATSTNTTTTAATIPSFRRGPTRHPARSATNAPITHSSPFASHMFLPISGAPGFAEERYGWDKGYSNELLRELEDVNLNGPSPRGEAAHGRKAGREMENVRDVRETRESAEENPREENVKDSHSDGNGGGRRESVVKRIKGKLDERLRTTSRSTSEERSEKENLGQGLGGGPSTIKDTKESSVVGVGEWIEKKIGSVELKGRKDATTVPLLDVGLADLLRAQLSALDRLPKAWHLVYSLDQHGISLQTLYTRCEAHSQAQAQAQAQAKLVGFASGTGTARTVGTKKMASAGRPGMMVVVKDSGDSVFGVWMGEGLRQSRGKGYYGSGESFMWRYAAAKQDAGAGKEKEFHVYKWTGKNKYVALCEPDYISFGGGDGRYGLYLDETLFDGSSAPCPTFDNKPLCSSGENKAGAVTFECVGLEVWGVGP